MQKSRYLRYKKKWNRRLPGWSPKRPVRDFELTDAQRYAAPKYVNYTFRYSEIQVLDECFIGFSEARSEYESPI